MHYVVAKTFIHCQQTSFLGFFHKIHYDYDAKQLSQDLSATQTVKLFDSYLDALEYSNFHAKHDDFDGLLEECWSSKVLPIYEVMLKKDCSLESYTPQSFKYISYHEIPANLILHTSAIFVGRQKINHLSDLQEQEQSSLTSWLTPK